MMYLMNPRCLGSLFRSLPLIVTIVVAGCNANSQTSARTKSIPVLTVSCEGGEDALHCRALEQVGGTAIDSHDSIDVTDTVVWTTSNARTAEVVRGHVTSGEPGSATIGATLRAGDETVYSSVLVVVGDDDECPQLAYDLKGTVRDLSNSGITDVQLTLSDDRGGERVAVTVQNGGLSDGNFRFAPVLRGQYRLRASKAGYRPVERDVKVPDTTRLTLVMLSEPR